MDWFLAIIPSVILTIILYGARLWIAAQLTRPIQHRYDKQLEDLRSELRKKENEFSALRVSVLSGAADRRLVIEKRRLEAVDQLWNAVDRLSKLKLAPAYMKAIKFKDAAKAAAKDPKTRDAFNVVAGQINLDEISVNNGNIARPFVSPRAWALFSAYSSIVTFAVAQLTFLRNGMGEADLLSDEVMIKLVKAALPHQESFIDAIGSSAANYLVDELEDAILLELQRMLAGEDGTKEAVEQAAEILKLSNEVDESLLRAPAAPP